MVRTKQASPEAPPESAPPADAPESAAPVPVTDLPKGGKAELFARRKPRRDWVAIEDTRYLVEAVKPGEMAWVSNQCFVRRPDADNPDVETIEWDGTKRGFYMVAIALRNPDGSRMFPGSLEDPSQWELGCSHVMDLGNEEYEPLFSLTNRLSGLAKGAREAAGKGSGKTPSTA